MLQDDNSRDAPQPNPSPLSHHIRSSLRLFNLLSSRTELDHPLCAECTDILLATLTRQLEETKKERDGYIAFEKDVRRERERDAAAGGAAGKAEADAKIERLKEEERLAIEQLKAAERERRQLEEELQNLERDEKALEEEEAECVCDRPSLWTLGIDAHNAGSGGSTTPSCSNRRTRRPSWRPYAQRTPLTLLCSRS